MKSLVLLISLLILALLSGQQASAQTGANTAQADSGITATRVIGEVRTVDAAAKQLTIKTDAGSIVGIMVADSTTYSRLPPGETTLAKAIKITIADLGEGDRVLAMGKVTDDHKSATARTVVVMTKADIAKKQEAERLEWRRRGILGVVASVKPETKEITLSTRSATGTQPVIVPVSENLDVRRYAPDSIKFSDAKPSGFEEFKVGDQVRALGDKSADGTHFMPEKIVAGSFHTVEGTVTAVDAAAGQIHVNDLRTKQPLTVIIKSDSVLRVFPAEMAMMMGGPSAAGAGGPGAATGSLATGRPPEGTGARAGAGQGGPRAGGPPSIQEILDRLPTISAADVKVGDTIIVSSTRGSDPTRLTAITLISGADRLLAIMAPRPQPGATQAAPNPAAGLGSGVTFGIGLP